MSPAVPPAVPHVLKQLLGPRWTTRLGRGTVACRKPDAGRTS